MSTNDNQSSLQDENKIAADTFVLKQIEVKLFLKDLSAISARDKLLFQKICFEEDFTFFMTRDEVFVALQNRKENSKVELPETAFNKEVNPPKTVEDLQKPTNALPADFYSGALKSSIDAEIEIICSDLNLNLNDKSPNFELTIRGRANLALCHKNHAYSVTVRRKELLLDKKQTDTNTFNEILKSRQFEDCADPFNPSKNPSEIINNFLVPSLGLKPAFLFDFSGPHKVLADEIFGLNKEKKTGLVVVSGTTGCGKSQVAWGLIWSYLTSLEPKNRRLHLITIEDPIETECWPWPVPNDGVSEGSPIWLDYTPRNLGQDVVSLGQALADAKRMTPAVVFIGETRSKRDWAEVVDFAGSGHLVITTTHAGSLVETLQRIFKAIHVTTPAERGNVAKSLLAVTHLQSFKLSPNNGLATKNALLPSLWMYEHGGGANLVADGFASVVPNNPTVSPSVSTGDPSKPKSYGSLGRTWFSEKIRQTASVEIVGSGNDSSEEYWDSLKKKALESDLNGI